MKGIRIMNLDDDLDFVDFEDTGANLFYKADDIRFLNKNNDKKKLGEMHDSALEKMESWLMSHTKDDILWEYTLDAYILCCSVLCVETFSLPERFTQILPKHSWIYYSRKLEYARKYFK